MLKIKSTKFLKFLSNGGATLLVGTFNRLRAVYLFFLVLQAKRANSENDYACSRKQKKKGDCSQYRTSVKAGSHLES